MSSEKRAHPKSENPGATILSKFKSHLEAQRGRLNDEIGSYPGPIPACDAQFNYLLEMRTDLSAKLNVIDELLAKCLADSPDEAAIEKLIARLSRFDTEMADKLITVFNIDPKRLQAPG